MFGKNQKVKFGTMYPNREIAWVTDDETRKTTLYEIREINRRDYFNHNLETFMRYGKKYAMVPISTF